MKLRMHYAMPVGPVQGERSKMNKKGVHNASLPGSEVKEGISGEQSRHLRNDEQDRGHEGKQGDGSGPQDGTEARVQDGQKISEEVTPKPYRMSLYGEQWRRNILGVTYRLFIPEINDPFPPTRIQMERRISVEGEPEEWAIMWFG